MAGPKPLPWAAMTKTLKIDFVSDVSCPWCVIGLRALQQAADRLKGCSGAGPAFPAVRTQPADGPAGGTLASICSRNTAPRPSSAKPPGPPLPRARNWFHLYPGARGRIYNTFDAHRLLHWAELQGCQLAPKQALFKAYFTDGQDPSNHDLLVRVAGGVGLNEDEARTLLASDRFAEEVRAREQFYLQQGIHSVPAIVINDRHLLQGGQPVEVFEQALRQIAAAE